MFQGNNVMDETGLSAVFADVSSSAAHIESSKLLDTISMLPGCAGLQADATSAYTQALLYGDGRIDPVDTWVSLPPEQQPASWAKFKTPVCRLRLALYSTATRCLAYSGNDTATRP